jgi:cell division protein FtsB
MSPVINRMEQEIGGLKDTNNELKAQIEKLTKT